MRKLLESLCILYLLKQKEALKSKLLKIKYCIFYRINSAVFPQLKHLQYGGPDGELGASLRYLSQRFSMPNDICKATLNDIATEEIGHLEMVGTIVYQLTRNLSEEQIKESGFDTYFVDHGEGIYPQSAAGTPFSASVLASKGDVITDLNEDLAAEQKARTTYDNILRLADDPDVIDVIKFLREREVVHYQRFGEALRSVLDMSDKKYYPVNYTK